VRDHGFPSEAAASGDPADRFIVATARRLDAVLLTRDAAVLEYGAAGHVKARPA